MARALRAVPAEVVEFDDLLRPEFREVELYLPPRDNPWLYGPHCTVEGCERPGNELIVDHARLCQRHGRRFKRGEQTIAEFLADAPLIAARTAGTGLPRFLLTADDPATEYELRLLMQTLHDGVHNVTFSTKRWNALRAIYAADTRPSLLDIDLSDHPASRVATASAKRFQKYLREVTESLAGRTPTRHDDVWDRRLYGHFADPMQSRPPVRMDFTVIRQDWLRESVKEVAWHRMGVEGITPTVAWDMARDVIAFADWAGGRLRVPSDMTRALLVEYLVHAKQTMASRTLSQRLSRLRLFLNHARVNGLAISSDATYLTGELAVRSALDSPPRYFDDAELAQLDAPENLAKLNDYNRRAYQVLRHTAMRQRSLVHIPFDCLTEAGGAHYLRFHNTKNRGGPVEHTVPVFPDLADVVRDQQAWVRSFWPAQDPTWLFPARNANPTGDRPAHVGAISNALIKWVRECGLQAADGQDLHFWPHRLRHTLGTQMINDGVPQHTVQEFYGHASPEMTAHYAKIHNQTLRREFDGFLDRVNRRGERIDLLPSGVAADAVLLKERLSRAKQSLPNGYCGIPVQQTCPHPNACLSCDGFVTDETFRPVLVEQRDRARAMADQAAAQDHQRLVEINLADVAALDAILSGLDDMAAPAADPAFDLRDLPSAS